jgi:ABC-type bacteriocin/lantibiotic exporter with double-glycine peptidase domain
MTLSNQANHEITTLLNNLWFYISPRRRWQFGLLLILMVLTSFAEVISIGAVLPFLAVLTEPERIFELPIVQTFIFTLKITEPKQLLLPLSVIFGFTVLIVGVMRLLLLWVNTKLSFLTGSDISIQIYRRTLYQSYAVHCNRNSSEIINTISDKTNIAINIISNVLSLISSIFILVAILITLLIINPIVALITFIGFGLIYASIILISRNRLLINSQIIAHESTQVVKSLHEGLGGIRDVLLDGTQDTYCKIYRKADLFLRRAQGNSSFISGCPRYAIEALGILLITIIAYLLADQDNGIASAIPILGALAIGAQRFLPALQQAYSAWAGIQGNQISLKDVLDLLDQPLPDLIDQQANQRIFLKKTISLKKLDFYFNPHSHYIFKNLNLTINKGSRIGFIGRTGSGKSTLLDIIMGLLQPTNGQLLIDNKVITFSNIRAWQANIAHVPQSIFLADCSVTENIALGIPKDEIDFARIKQVAIQAQIAKDIESWPDKYNTFVGERGIRLSGGQRQRIGIARALYKKADVIVLDEATSALDYDTEEAVIQAIESLNKDLTLLIVTHRLSILRNCSKIIELNHGNVIQIRSYKDIVKSSQKNKKSKSYAN